MTHDMVAQGPQMVGGPGVIVQIDECFFAGKRKYNVGRVRGIAEPWVLGIIDTATKKVCMFQVPNRTRATLHGHIVRYVAPGSVIVTDCWAAYYTLDTIPGLNYTHETVNHTTNFVNPLTGFHTQEIEGFWSHAKAAWKASRGYGETVRTAYLDEIQWRWNNRGTHTFQKLMQITANHDDYRVDNWPNVTPAELALKPPIVY